MCILGLGDLLSCPVVDFSLQCSRKRPNFCLRLTVAGIATIVVTQVRIASLLQLYSAVGSLTLLIEIGNLARVDPVE